jgi:hypothetical protein
VADDIVPGSHGSNCKIENPWSKTCVVSANFRFERQALEKPRRFRIGVKDALFQLFADLSVRQQKNYAGFESVFAHWVIIIINSV